ncbi:MAG: hypothetical protein WCD47_07980 [Candidatus Sulfotelmatobacter sp.]
MNLIALTSKRAVMVGAIYAVVFFTVRFAVASGSMSPSDPPKPVACRAPEYKQFDFRVGIGMHSMSAARLWSRV